MEILLWILGVHLLEVILYLGYVLIMKNKKMEEVLISQQETIDSIKILINRMDDNFKEIDQKIWVSEDPELNGALNNIKEIQNILNSIK